MFLFMILPTVNDRLVECFLPKWTKKRTKMSLKKRVLKEASEKFFKALEIFR